MQRRSPLQELPLELFLPPYTNLAPGSVKPIKRNKRPPSPSGPTPFSPAKRRILNDEGVHSPEKTCKSPFPSITARLASPARFGHALAGSANPARVLDFGLPKNVDGDPQKRPSATNSHVDVTSTSPSQHLAPSPELKAKATPPTRNMHSADVFQDEESDYEDDMNDFSPEPTVSPIFILRERPIPLNPLSVHYPGFAVYQDPHVVIFPNVGTRHPPEPVEPEAYKENIAPPRMARPAPIGTPGCVFDSRSAPPTRSGFVDKTPSGMDLSSAEELSSTISRHKLRISSPSSDSRKARRQAMKDEMDATQD